MSANRTPARRSILAAAVLTFTLVSNLAAAGETGLPVPRWVSISATEVNLRTGPGMTYPVDWVYQRKNLPVEVLTEFESWRKIRDWEGTTGWVHQSMLDGRRMGLVTGADSTLRTEPRSDAPPIARLAAGVIGQIDECLPQWCRVEAGGYEGWLARADFFGTYPDEVWR